MLPHKLNNRIDFINLKFFKGILFEFLNMFLIKHVFM